MFVGCRSTTADPFHAEYNPDVWKPENANIKLAANFISSIPGE